MNWPRRRWALRAVPADDSVLAEIMADTYNKNPMKYWFWSSARRSTQVGVALGAPVKFLILKEED